MLNLTPRCTRKLPDELPSSIKPLFEQSPTLARLYVARGIQTLDELDYSLGKLLSADGLRDIDNAVQLLDDAIDAQKKILIVGDFDCDGATSTALMMRVLGKMGALVDYVVPDRFKYGYGLTPEIVQLGIDEYQPDVIVTVDNGISSHDGVDKAKAHGITVIITDHHLTTKPTPKADAVVNPNQLDCDFESKALVGVGVAFYLLGRLAKRRRDNNKSTVQVSQYLDLVALGTIADVGVLDHNNRTLVHHGLNAIREGRCCVGILALLEQSGRDHKQMRVQDFGFVLGPRINAAGRMDNMRIGIECLLADDFAEAQKLAFALDKLNQERRRVEGGMREQADDILRQLQLKEVADSLETDAIKTDVIEADVIEAEKTASSTSDTNKPTSKETILSDSTLSKSSASKSSANQTDTSSNQIDANSHRRSVLLYQDDWHQGVIGIVAGRLKETYYLPTIIFAPADTSQTGEVDAIKGSARSIAGVHIRDAIEQVAEANPALITHFGGHAMAAGLTLKKENLPAFADAFEALMQSMDERIFREEKLTDGQLLASDFSLNFVEMLNNTPIWGHGFVLPQFDGVFNVASFKILKDKHLKLSLIYPNVQYPIDAIWFNFDSKAWDYQAKQVHILFELDVNEWNGNKNIQLMVKDLMVIN